VHQRQQQNTINWQHACHTHIVCLSCLPAVNSALCKHKLNVSRSSRALLPNFISLPWSH